MLTFPIIYALLCDVSLPSTVRPTSMTPISTPRIQKRRDLKACTYKVRVTTLFGVRRSDLVMGWYVVHTSGYKLYDYTLMSMQFFSVNIKCYHIVLSINLLSGLMLWSVTSCCVFIAGVSRNRNHC